MGCPDVLTPDPKKGNGTVTAGAPRLRPIWSSRGRQRGRWSSRDEGGARELARRLPEEERTERAVTRPASPGTCEAHLAPAFPAPSRSRGGVVVKLGLESLRFATVRDGGGRDIGLSAHRPYRR